VDVGVDVDVALLVVVVSFANVVSSFEGTEDADGTSDPFLVSVVMAVVEFEDVSGPSLIVLFSMLLLLLLLLLLAPFVSIFMSVVDVDESAFSILGLGWNGVFFLSLSLSLYNKVLSKDFEVWKSDY